MRSSSTAQADAATEITTRSSRVAGEKPRLDYFCKAGFSEPDALPNGELSIGGNQGGPFLANNSGQTAFAGPRVSHIIPGCGLHAPSPQAAILLGGRRRLAVHRDIVAPAVSPELSRTRIEAM